MARLNIEDCWWSDPRREKLGELLGSMALADAMAIRAWRLAQQFWADGRQLVPLHIFKQIEANAKLIEANLAEVRGEYVYVRGSSQYLDWLHERRAAARAGGKKSAEKRGKSAKQTPSKTKQTQPSGSISGSISSSKNINNAQFDFEAVYSAYPRRLGKKRGLQIFSKEIQTEQDYLLLKTAVQNYAASVAGKDPEYIKHFSTFMNNWRDYIEKPMLSVVNEKPLISWGE